MGGSKVVEDIGNCKTGLDSGFGACLEIILISIGHRMLGPVLSLVLSHAKHARRRRLPPEPREERTAAAPSTVRLMDKILHDLKDSKLWELWYIPYP